MVWYVFIGAPGIIHLFGQYRPGKPTGGDDADSRVHAFQRGLDLIVGYIMQCEYAEVKLLYTLCWHYGIVIGDIKLHV